MGKSYYNIIETLAFICTVKEGNLQILLKRKKTDPYQGCWILPGNILSTDETLETSVKNTVYETTGVIVKKMMQTNVFSDLNRDAEGRIIACSYAIVINQDKVLKSKDMETKWFDIKALPKMGYDHEKIINTVFNSLTKKIIYNENNIIREFFPNEFTLGDFQKFWQGITNESYDRRNFRKKLISSGLIMETGNYNRTKSGRPSKYYNFTDKLSEGNLI